MTIKILKLLFIYALLPLTFLGLFGCATDDKKADSPEGAYQIAKEFEEADRYEVALQKYADVKNKFPYSSFAPLAELAIADVQYKRESFAEAQIAYQNFRDLHPKHPKIDYVIFRIGMSYYMQLPETIDRDLSLAQDAIYAFDEVIKLFPRSENIKAARENREKAYIMLVEKELYVADFYYKQEKFDSALTRYEMAYNKYPGFGYDPRSLLGAIRSADKVSELKKKRQYTSILLSKFSQSDEAKKIKKEEL
ncbi:MAG: outer membrane protein assembly factor BamD [Bdellovibrionaceae bacterium]|nr:outer membrane protein assembly factor BamD [Bdellovibrio sp.]